MNILSYIGIFLGLVLAPLLSGIINRTKAIFAGRRGTPLLQSYYDIGKLLRKDAVYSKTTSWIFQITPSVGLAAILSAMLVTPLGAKAPLAFCGDIIFLIYCLAMARFFTVIAALDTGSSFEGMGASREVMFAAIAEPALIIGIATLARISGTLSLSSIFAGITTQIWLNSGTSLILLIVAFFVVLLAENSRIPFDDPNTHLELTMIHEVMILDYGGPDLGIILYSASLKLWVLGALIINTIIPVTGVTGITAFIMFFGGMIILAVLAGIVESIMARLKLLKVPQILVAATALSCLAFALVLRLKP